MKGDFSRVTHNTANRFSSVLMQQGRVLLDADWNEQTAIILHYLRTLGADLIGPNGPDEHFKHGGPGNSFHIVNVDDGSSAGAPYTFGITPGHYYVDGILIENDRQDPLPFGYQPDWPVMDKDRPLPSGGGSFLVYLDVWERLITSLENDYIREVALGDADTCARSQVVWQVKTLPFTHTPPGTRGDRDATPEKASKRSTKAAKAAAAAPGVLENIDKALEYLANNHSTARLAADLQKANPDPDPCITPPESRYRGAENQLYRVEIHNTDPNGITTFKWSRDNGSVTFPIVDLETSAENVVVELEHLGRDLRSSLEVNDWVEMLDDDDVLREEPGRLMRVTEVDHEASKVTLQDDHGGYPSIPAPGKNALLRRWDHRNYDKSLTLASDGAFEVVEDEWLILEDGIQIRFSSTDPDGADSVYSIGDYWLIPARTNGGLIYWPKVEGTSTPQELPALGVHHHYAPLAIANVTAAGAVTFEYDYGPDNDKKLLRRTF